MKRKHPKQIVRGMRCVADTAHPTWQDTIIPQYAKYAGERNSETVWVAHHDNDFGAWLFYREGINGGDNQEDFDWLDYWFLRPEHVLELGPRLSPIILTFLPEDFNARA